jgi:hypothetical protein
LYRISNGIEPVFPFKFRDKTHSEANFGAAMAEKSFNDNGLLNCIQNHRFQLKNKGFYRK